MKIIHVTDTHLRDPGELLFEDDPADRLRACVDDINEDHGDAALCLVTGDLVHDGTVSSYAVLKNELSRLRVPYRLLLGNHDHRDHFKTAFREAEIDSNGFVQSCVDIDETRFVLLDTLQHGTHQGWLCEARLHWLDERLAESGDRSVVIAMHHPPISLHHAALDRMNLVQHEAFEALVRRSPRIRHIFFGHVHRSVMGTWAGVSFSTLHGTTGLSRVGFADTRQTPRVLPPPAFATAFVSGHQIVIHTHTARDPSPRFRYEPSGMAGAEPTRLS